MPREHFDADHEFLAREDILTYEEITKIASTLMPLGLAKLRITGGEPLMRKDIVKLVRMLRDLNSDVDLAMTTNGVLLKRHAASLKEAGLDRVTVSLDALDTDLFQSMGDTHHSPEEVMAGVDAALEVGLQVKVNMVVQRNVNESQVVPIAAFCFERNIIPRFIEFMDVGSTNQWELDSVVSGEEIRSLLAQTYGEVNTVSPDHPSDVAKRWKTEQGHMFGLIQSVTAPFCGDCSRARISANGSMYTCLFANEGHDLRAMLRFGANATDIEAAIRTIWTARKDRYSEGRKEHKEPKPKIEMSFIGG
jgi:cyclic pyranopterin phosphate synthase